MLPAIIHQRRHILSDKRIKFSTGQQLPKNYLYIDHLLGNLEAVRRSTAFIVQISRISKIAQNNIDKRHYLL